MKIKIIMLLILLVGLGNCKKAKFEPFNESFEILLLDKAVVDILSEPKMTSKSLGNFSGKDKVEATGVSKLDNFTFIQVKCPASITDCKDGLGYIPQEMIYDFIFTSKTKGYLIKSSSIDKARAILDWFSNPSGKLPDSISTDFIRVFLYSIQNPDENLKKVTELYLFFKAFQEPLKAKDFRMEPIRKKYSALKELYTIFIEKGGEGWETSYLSKVSIENSVLNSLRNSRDSAITEIENGFPFRKDSWKGLASEFNNLSGVPYLKEKILLNALTNTTYTVTNAPYSKIGPNSGGANWELDIRITEGVFVRENPSDPSKTISPTPVTDAEGNTVKPELEILDVKAIAEKNGIGFSVKMNSGEFTLTPDEIPPYLATGGPGLKALIASIPKNYKEIQEKYSFNKALLYTALAFGTGEFDHSKGKMNYSITVDSETKYWMVFGLIQKSPNNQLEGKGFTGKIAYREWRQPKGEFIVKEEIGCDGPCPPVDHTCFTMSSNTNFYIRFSPSEINKEKPLVDFEIDSDKYVCKDVISYLPEKEKK
ncbi:MAG: hypothetical protein KBA66_19350 [Leptospiraceae bacterium]|nr:hypothetical protein [Leptospiraceae bacterium]